MFLIHNKINGLWRIAFWILFLAWIVGALLNMNRFKGGFLTNYLADVAFPPWYYIYLRGLWSTSKKTPQVILFGTWFGQTPERAAISIFLVGAISEVITLYWPNGIIRGTFDPMDILVYFSGLLICYVLDKNSDA